MARSSKSRKTETSTPSARTPFPKLAQPALRALAGAGYDHLEQLDGIPEASLAGLHGIGPNALAKLREAMGAIGLSFAAPRSQTSGPGNGLLPGETTASGRRS